jgi:UDP-glucose 4-epimerase
LLRENIDVTVVDNLSSGTLSHIENFLSNSGFKFQNFDVRNTEMLTEVLRGKDVVVHLASNPDIAKAATEPRIDFLQGTILTESVAEASRISGIKTLIYASGSGVYLDQGEEILGEDSQLQPISTYGASKLSGEMLLSAYSHMFELKSIVVRFANVVGPKQTHGVGYDFIRRLKLNPSFLEILGDGLQTKSYIYVTDVISAMKFVLDNSFDCPFDVFNVATQDYITVNQIAKIACQISGINLNEIKFTYTGGDRGWKGDVPKISFDTKKIRDLGWENKYSSFEAITHSISSMNLELLE